MLFSHQTTSACSDSRPGSVSQQTEPGWTASETEAYLRRFHYRLGPEDLQGLERFESLAREHGLVENE